MVAASVGFQCPECVREGSRSVRTPRTMAGGLLPARVGRVTFTVIGLNVAFFVVTLATGGTTGPFFEWGAMLARSATNGQGQVLTGVADGAYWRLLTAAFLHEGILHIAFNMYALYIFGPLLEKYLGVGRFIAMYVSVAIASSVVVYFLSAPNALTIGASGAVFGLFAVALVLLHHQGQNVQYLLVLLGLNAVISLTGNISWQGHLGGFLAGLILGAAFAYAPRDKRALVQVSVFGAMWVAIVVGVVVRTGQLSA